VSWRTVARRDRRLLLDGRLSKVALAGLVGLVAVAAYVYPVVGRDPITTGRFVTFVDGWLGAVLPPIGVLFGYGAVAREHESGALRLALSLPHGRAALVLGRFAGRAGVLAGGVVAALAVGAALVVYPFGTLEPLRLLAFTALCVVYAAVWVGIGVGASALVATNRRALALAVGALVALVVVWNGLTAATEAGLARAGIADGPLRAAVAVAAGLDPGSAFGTLAAAVDPSAPPADAWYEGPALALPVLLGWLVGPLALGLARFVRRDLS
jgi:ABC-2 type transport system permease protein